jgi:hypothetical protein
VGSLSIATDGKTIGCVFHRKFHLYKLPWVLIIKL